MRSFRSADRLGPEDPSDAAVLDFDDLWNSGEPSIQQFWSKLGPGRSVSTLAALVKLDIQHRFRLGQRPRASDYFEAFPILVQSRDRVVSLVYEEFCLLEESGEDVDSGRFCEQYEPWRDSLLSQLAYHRELSIAIGAESPSVKFPGLGERFGKYQLQSILGKGGVAQVYLATEDELGGRQIALKISASIGQEPSILANLAHQNIVPIHTVTETESGLRGICMPYRPGITLEELIRRIGRGTPPKSARAIWDKMHSPGDEAGIDSADQLSGWAGFPVDGTFSEGVAWIGLSLANALFYLHGRGVLHRDIKPANILLAHREGPQLLDFNLAQDPKAPENVQAALKGGTLPYMGPEHLRAFIDPNGWGDVGPAADLYSLGLVLRELVTGKPPVLPGPNLSVPRGIRALIDRRTGPQEPIRDINPNVPPSLDSIITKCLEVEPPVRYSDASKLAGDLERFLEREPLKFAPNPSIVERGVNWSHRNRSLAMPVILFLVLLGGFFYSIQPPPPIQETREFRRAVAQLDSDQPDEWKRSKETFDRLTRENPNVAWPVLYSGLALEKLGHSQEANEIIIGSQKFRDAEVALRERLKVTPRSATLLSAYVMLLTGQKRIDEAWKTLKEAERFDPDRPYILLRLGEIERDRQNHLEAIRYFSKAIAIGEQTVLKAETVYPWRMGLLVVLARQANAAVDRGLGVASRGELSNLLAQLKSTLEILEMDWAGFRNPSGREIHIHTQAFFRACVASYEAVLAIGGDDSRLPDALMTRAFALLDEAQESIPATADREKFAKPIRESRARFDRWRKTLIAPEKPAEAA